MAILPLQKIEAFHDAAGDKNIQIRTQNDSRLGFLNSLYILTRNEATHRKKTNPTSSKNSRGNSTNQIFSNNFFAKVVASSARVPWIMRFMI